MGATLRIVRRVARNTFQDAYDHLGLLMLANALWFVCALPVATLPLACAGLMGFTYELATRRDAELKDFFRGAAALWRPAFVLAAGAAALFVMAAGNVAFYLRIAQGYPLIGVALAAVCVWMTLAVLLALQFAAPAAADLRLADDSERLARSPRGDLGAEPLVRRLGMEGGRGAPAAVKTGFILFLQAPGPAILCLAGQALWWALCVAAAAPVVLCAAGVSALACHHLYAETIAELAGLGDRRKPRPCN